ncbi:MAG: hypothetical protein RBR71_12140 [Gudongella sp.]|nr:hypothetical protein [Gudongella sp.]
MLPIPLFVAALMGSAVVLSVYILLQTTAVFIGLGAIASAAAGRWKTTAVLILMTVVLVMGSLLI